jgi:hypothetical protein
MLALIETVFLWARLWALWIALGGAWHLNCILSDGDPGIRAAIPGPPDSEQTNTYESNS